MATGCDGEEAEEEEEEEGSHKLSSTPHQKKKKKLLTQTPPTKTSVSDAFLSPGVLLEVGKRGRGKQRPTRGTRASMHPTNARPTNIPSRQGKMGEGSDTMIEAGVTIFFLPRNTSAIPIGGTSILVGSQSFPRLLGRVSYAIPYIVSCIC